MVIKNIILKSKMVIFNTLNFFIFGISMNICILMLNKFIHLFIVCVCTCTPLGICGGQRTTPWYQLFPSTR